MSSAEEILNYIGQTAQFFQNLIWLDNMIVVTDNKKYLFHYPGKELSLGNIVGTDIPDGDMICSVLETGALKNGTVDQGDQGIVCNATIIPIKYKGEHIIGTMCFAISLNSHKLLCEEDEVPAYSLGDMTDVSESLPFYLAGFLNKIADMLNKRKSTI